MKHWRDEAACLGHDPELWQESVHEGPWAPAADTENTRFARNICGTCPVREACLQDALQYVERSDVPTSAYGIFGGLDARERYRLVFPVQRPNHNADKTHCKRGHEFAGANLIVNSRGARQCRECRRLLRAKDRAQAKAIRESAA